MIAEECGADELFVDCTAAKAVAPGSSSSVKLSRFFDLVIEKRFQNRDRPSPFDKRRLAPGFSSNFLNQKMFHYEWFLSLHSCLRFGFMYENILNFSYISV